MSCDFEALKCFCKVRSHYRGTRSQPEDGRALPCGQGSRAPHLPPGMSAQPPAHLWLQECGAARGPQQTAGWVASQCVHFSGSGRWKPGSRAPWSVSLPAASCRLLAVSLPLGPQSFMGPTLTTSSNCSHFPKAPHPDVITSKVGGHTNQSIAGLFCLSADLS